MGNSASQTNARSLRESLVGLDCIANMLYPVFAQPFISDSRFATEQEINEYMHALGFKAMFQEGYFENESYILSDIRPKNVLCSQEKTIFVIDAEISKKII